MSIFAISIRAYFSSTTAQLAPHCCDYGTYSNRQSEIFHPPDVLKTSPLVMRFIDRASAETGNRCAGTKPARAPVSQMSRKSDFVSQRDSPLFALPSEGGTTAPKSIPAMPTLAH